MSITFISLTVALHLEVQEEYRGRLGSIVGLGFFALGPLASFPLGWAADHIGYDKIIISLGLFFGLSSFLLFLLNNIMKKPIKTDKQAV